MDKEDVVCAYKGILLSHKKNEIMSLDIWMDLEIILSGESQGHGSVVGCHLWGRAESDTTEAT